MVRVCLAGATGWAGSELARAIGGDLELVSAVSRSHAGQKLGATPVFATAAEALAVPCDVFVEYTTAKTAKANILVALQHGAHVVVGSSGLTDGDFVEIDALARTQQRGVLACGNFAITMVLMQKFAEIAAKYVPSWEILDYAYEGKPDAPSGTARELAGRLAKVRQPEVAVAIADTAGVRESRGGNVAGTQVHSIRLPGFVIATEVILGLPDQKLTMRHDAGASAKPYVDGALLAIRKVSGLVGLHRGLDTVMDL
jgi:4-hydroxy-tetrahydrodipicolinate reductase